MQDNTRKITYGAMMISLFLILLAVSYYIPLIGLLTMLFVPLPIILFRLRYDRLTTGLVTLMGIAVSIFVGGLLIVPFAFVFGVVGFVIGDTVQRKKSKLYTFMAAGTSFLIIALLSYVASIYILNMNVIDELIESIRLSFNEVETLLMGFGGLPENFNEMKETTLLFYETAIPAIFILGAFSMAFIVVSLNVYLIKRLGHSVEKFPPFREMKLPVIAVWYYLIVLFLPFIFKVEIGTTINLVYVNATIILRFLFMVQGVAFVHYTMHAKKLPTWVTVISTFFALLLSPVTVLLGILDAGINIRGMINKDKKK